MFKIENNTIIFNDYFNEPLSNDIISLMKKYDKVEFGYLFD